LLITACIPQQASAQTPEINKKIVEYVNSVKGKKVDRGECWDLINEALNTSHAKWTPTTGFGKIIDPKKEEVFPGDVIAFEKVKVKRPGMLEDYPHHYAIVYEVKSKGAYIIIHQNSDGKRKVTTWDFDLATVTKGKVTFFRPQE